MKKVVLTLALIFAVALSASAQFIIDGTEITFPDSSTQSTAATGGGGGGVTRHHVVHVTSENSNSDNGTNLLDAITAITDAGWGQEYVILLDPGEYHVGSNPLTMKPHVSITGMGQAETKIVGNGAVTVQGAFRASLRSMAIENHSNGVGSAVYKQIGSDVELYDINIFHGGDGTGSNYGIKLEEGAGVEMHKFNIEYYGDGSGGGSFTGIHLSGYADYGDESEGSWADCGSGYIEAEADNVNMDIIGIQVGAGIAVPGNVEDSVAVDLLAGVNIDVTAAAGKATGIKVLANCEAFLLGPVVGAEDLTETLDANKALDNAGSVFALNATFFGYLDTTGYTNYTNCAKVYTDFDIAPIVNTNAPVPAVAP